MKAASTTNNSRVITILFVLIMIPAGLYLDSLSVSLIFPWGQTLANVVMITTYLVIYKGAPRKLKKIMFYGLFIALAGEALFSLVFGMYEYRLENIPVYVPPGHAIIYACVYYFVREPIVIRNQALIEKSLMAFAIIYGVFWLFYDNDLYGFICLLGLFAIYRYNRASGLFLLVMYTVVAYLEQVGTIYGCWYWPTIAFDSWAWLPSGNPPSAISIFYFAFDVVCIKIYLRLHKNTRFRLKRFQANFNAAASE